MGLATVLKGVGSFYTLAGDAGETVTVRARGSLRRDGRLTVGDRVEYEDGTIRKILPRTSFLARPAVANATRMAVVISLADPATPDALVSKMLITAQQAGLSAVLVANKTDIAGEGAKERFSRVFGACGAVIVFLSALTGEGVDSLHELISDGVTVFSGVSGAGKSTLTALLAPESNAASGELSPRIMRGRQTTRAVERFTTSRGAVIFDTPGFSSLRLEGIAPERLEAYFPEFAELEPCRFTGCAHTGEPGCAVSEAVAAGGISEERHACYKKILAELALKPSRPARPRTGRGR